MSKRTISSLLLPTLQYFISRQPKLQRDFFEAFDRTGKATLKPQEFQKVMDATLMALAGKHLWNDWMWWGFATGHEWGVTGCDLGPEMGRDWGVTRVTGGVTSVTGVWLL